VYRASDRLYLKHKRLKEGDPMKISSRKQKIRTGTSVIIALAMGAFGIMSSNAPTQAAEPQMQQQSIQDSSQKSLSSCTYYRGRSSTSVVAYAYACYKVQAAALCYRSGSYDWVYGSLARTSRATCRNGWVTVKGAVRGKVFSTSPVSAWQYFY
jgi:hypothetical protein